MRRWAILLTLVMTTAAAGLTQRTQQIQSGAGRWTSGFPGVTILLQPLNVFALSGQRRPRS